MKWRCGRCGRRVGIYLNEVSGRYVAHVIPFALHRAVLTQESADPVRCPKCGGPHPFHDPACVVHPDLTQDHNEQEHER